MAGSTSREELIAAARAHLDEHGLDGLTLREVARRAGVSHGAPLRHFPSLAALCSAVAADAFDGLYAQVAAAMDEVVVDDARRRLHAAGRGYLRFAVANPGPFHLMFHRELCDVDDPHLTAASGAAFAQLLYATSEAQAAGWRPDEPTAEAAALLWAQVHGLATLHLLGSLPRAVAGNGGDPDLFHLFDRSYEALAADPGRTP